MLGPGRGNGSFQKLNSKRSWFRLESNIFALSFRNSMYSWGKMKKLTTNKRNLKTFSTAQQLKYCKEKASQHLYSILECWKRANLVVFQLHQTVGQGWVASSVPPQMHCRHTTAEVTAAPCLRWRCSKDVQLSFVAQETSSKSHTVYYDSHIW